MIKPIILYIKLIFIFLCDLFHRIRKFVKFLWLGKHEIERICEMKADIYEKAFKVDEWLHRSNCRPISDFLERHFQGDPRSSRLSESIDQILNKVRSENFLLSEKPSKTKSKRKNANFNYKQTIQAIGDINLAAALTTATSDLISVIKKSKQIKSFPPKSEDCLWDVCYRILSYKATTSLAEKFAATKYNSDVKSHTDKLLSLWNNLVKADQLSEPKDSRAFPEGLSEELNDETNIISSRWSHIGFQGEDPGTDFRGMGILGLMQLEYLAKKPKNLAVDLLKRSLNEKYNYPFAITGINITYNLLNLYKDGSLKHFYYDTGDCLFRNKRRNLDLLNVLNDIYVELYLRFDCYWRQSKPDTIFAFKELMEKFVMIVKMDLYDRDFGLKFIY